MDSRNLDRPGQLIPGKTYWLCLKYFDCERLCKEKTQSVVFSSYRAHPAEVVVRINQKSVIVARKDIYQKVKTYE